MPQRSPRGPLCNAVKTKRMSFRFPDSTIFLKNVSKNVRLVWTHSTPLNVFLEQGRGKGEQERGQGGQRGANREKRAKGAKGAKGLKGTERAKGAKGVKWAKGAQGTKIVKEVKGTTS